VAQTDRRIIEAARLGFRKIYVSSFSSLEGVPEEVAKVSGGNVGVKQGIEIIKVADVPSLCKALFKA
jgi:DNA repair protein RadA/Sms